MGMQQHQSDVTGYVNEHGNLRRSEGDGVISGTDNYSGYEQTSVTADSHFGYEQMSVTADSEFDNGAPVHRDEEQQNKITNVREPSQQHLQHANLAAQDPARNRQSGYGRRVTEIHFKELRGVWLPGDRLHIPVTAQLQDGQKLPVKGKAVVMIFIGRNTTNDLSWERRLVGFDGA